MLIEVTDDLIELGIRYLYRKPIDLMALAKVEDVEYNVACLPVKLIFQPSEPESIITAKRTKFICIDLDAGNEFCQVHNCIYIPKRFVDHPRTIYAIFLDGVWIDRYEQVGAVFLTKKDANQYMKCEREHLENLGVIEWK